MTNLSAVIPLTDRRDELPALLDSLRRAGMTPSTIWVLADRTADRPLDEPSLRWLTTDPTDATGIGAAEDLFAALRAAQDATPAVVLLLPRGTRASAVVLATMVFQLLARPADRLVEIRLPADGAGLFEVVLPRLRDTMAPAERATYATALRAVCGVFGGWRG